MDKFTISHLKDYFLRTNEQMSSFKSLSAEDLLTLSVLSIFDKSGVTAKIGSEEYVKPDGVISLDELNKVTQKDYEKFVKDINKQIKKEKGKDIDPLNIPTYAELQEMLKSGDKIDFAELHAYAREGKIVNPDAPKPQAIKIPKKTGNNDLTVEAKADFITRALDDPKSAEILARVEAKLDEAETNGTKAYDFTPLQDGIDAVHKMIDDFQPDDDIESQAVVGMDVEQYNPDGQRVGRVNNTAGFYEKYSYDSEDKDAKYSEMIRYNANGYKSEYFRRMNLVDKDGNLFEGVVIYSLDENEKIRKITYPQNADVPQIVTDFNEYKHYERVMDYANDLPEV